MLTPNRRRNTPDPKIALRLGINRASYSNDRYLNNELLDVGEVSGETAIYTGAAGFGLTAGVEVEFPMNTGFSIVAAAEFNHVHFGGSGAVQQECRSATDTSKIQIGSALHDFSATIQYLKVAGAAKLSFNKFYILLGLAAEKPLTSSLGRIRSFEGGDCLFVEERTNIIREQGEIPDPTGLHYSFRTGVGLVYPLTSRLQFSPELLLDFGFNPINKSQESDLGVYSLCVTLRYDLR